MQAERFVSDWFGRWSWWPLRVCVVCFVREAGWGVLVQEFGLYKLHSLSCLKASEKTCTLLKNCIKHYPAVKEETSSRISEREYYNILMQCQQEMPPDPSWSSLRDAIHLKVQVLTAKEDDQSNTKKAKTQGPEQEQVTLGHIDIDSTTSCIIQVYIQSALYTMRGW